MSCTARNLYYERLGATPDSAVTLAEAPTPTEAVVLSHAQHGAEAKHEASDEESQGTNTAVTSSALVLDEANEEQRRREEEEREEAEAEEAMRAFKAKQVSDFQSAWAF